MLLKKITAEFLGTFTLVFFGCGAATIAFDRLHGVDMAASELMIYKMISTVCVAMVFGLAIVACAYIFGDISGCHVNPAVSLAMLLCGKIDIKTFAAYVPAQCAGAFAGCGLLYFIANKFAIVGNPAALTYGANSVGGTTLGSLVLEAVLTFVFVLAILGVTSTPKNSTVSGLVIGFTLTFVHLIGIPFTGTSVNPARSLAPAVFAGGAALDQLWVFIVAPLAGAAVAAIVYRFLSKENDD